MTTQHWATPIDNTTDAGFRAWGSEFASKLTAAGLVQTSDTGQINWGAVTLPGGGSAGGYEIYRMNDSMQSTAPVFFKITYGTNGSNGASLKIIHGTATDGAGNLSGATVTPSRECEYAATNAGSTTTAFDSYVCVNDGFFGFYFKMTPSSGSPAGNDALFIFNRTCDATGAPTAQGAMIIWAYGNGGYSFYYTPVRYESPAQLFTTVGGSYKGCTIFNPQPSSIDDSGNAQVYIHYTVTPSVRPMFGMCTVFAADVSQGNTFTATLIGTTARTYLAVRSGFYAESSGGTNLYTYALLWE